MGAHAFPRRKLKPDEVLRLRELFPTNTSQRVADLMGLRISQVFSFAYRLGLQKSPEHIRALRVIEAQKLSRLGQQTRFSRSHLPWNSGKKCPHLAGNSGQFKKQNTPHNAVVVGAVVPDSDGVLKQKIAEPNVWEYVHRMNWEAAHGPIPSGHCVCFIDGNSGNPSMENLQLRNRAELIKFNTIHRYPETVQSLIRLTAKVKRTLEKRRSA